MRKCDFNKSRSHTLHGCSLNCINIRRTSVLKNVYKHMIAGIHLFRVKIEKLKQGVKHVQS